MGQGVVTSLPQEGGFMYRDRWIFEKRNLTNPITGAKFKRYNLTLIKANEHIIRIVFDDQGTVTRIKPFGFSKKYLGLIYLKINEILKKEH